MNNIKIVGAPPPVTKPVTPNRFGHDHAPLPRRVSKVGACDNGTRSGVLTKSTPVPDKGAMEGGRRSFPNVSELRTTERHQASVDQVYEAMLDDVSYRELAETDHVPAVPACSDGQCDQRQPESVQRTSTTSSVLVVVDGASDGVQVRDPEVCQRTSGDSIATADGNSVEHGASARDVRTVYVNRCNCKRSLKLPVFDGVSMHFEAYMNMFTTACKYQEWSPEVAAVQLRLLLRESATDILMDPESSSWSFQQLVDELRRRFAPEALIEQYKFLIKTRKRRCGETLGDLYRDMWRLGVLAYPTDQRTEIFDQTMVDSFINSLVSERSDLAEKVRDRFPRTLYEAYEVSVLLEGNVLFHPDESVKGNSRPGVT